MVLIIYNLIVSLFFQLQMNFVLQLEELSSIPLITNHLTEVIGVIERYSSNYTPIY